MKIACQKQFRDPNIGGGAKDTMAPNLNIREGAGPLAPASYAYVVYHTIVPESRLHQNKQSLES